jgi:transcriptional regulator with XRE-family HTH domain
VADLLVRLAAYRTSLEISQREIGAALKVDRRTVNRWENRVTEMPLVMAEEYARHLGGRLVFVADETAEVPGA